MTSPAPERGAGPADTWSPGLVQAVAEVVALAGELIAIDNANTGDASVPGTERAAAEYVAAKLTEVG